jgi:hypothetical protein
MKVALFTRYLVDIYAAAFFPLSNTKLPIPAVCFAPSLFLRLEQRNGKCGVGSPCMYYLSILVLGRVHQVCEYVLAGGMTHEARVK